MLYMLRRHCRLGVAEFRALPWEEQELLREGLREEFSPERWREAARQVQGAETGEESLAALYDTDAAQEAPASSVETLMGLGLNMRTV